jgi:hypothetical protein
LAFALALPGAAPAQSLLPPAMGAAAAASATGPVVRSVEIRFKGDATVDRERILSNMRLKAGETYTKEKEEEDLRALYNTGDLLDVQFTTVDVPGGVKLIVNAEARAGLGDIEFTGNSVFTATRLRQEIELKVGGSVDDTKLAKAKDAILEVYKSKGYPDATVDHTDGLTVDCGDWWFNLRGSRRLVLVDRWSDCDPLGASICWPDVSCGSAFGIAWWFSFSAVGLRSVCTNDNGCTNDNSRINDDCCTNDHCRSI